MRRLASKTFTNPKDLFKYLNNEAKKTLQQRDTNVENLVVSEFIESIEENVYDSYHSPPQVKTPYIRQRENDGLIDRDNFRVENIDSGIAISSSRQGVDGYGRPVDVMEVLEGNSPWGVQDIWGYGFEDRPDIVQPVRDKLKNSKSLRKAFELDLKNKGFRVK